MAVTRTPFALSHMSNRDKARAGIIYDQAVRAGNASYQSVGGSSRSSYSRAVSNVNSTADMLSQIREMQDYNSAKAANEARIQRDWQEQQNAKAMSFNASEAAKNRDWQEMMSNTAHQREIADLQAAGLNPILSASGGNGAAVTSGATASGVTSSGAKGEVDMSGTNALVNLFGTLLDNQNKIQLQDMSARANMQVAELQTSTQRMIQDMINANSQLLSDKNNRNAVEIAKLNASAAMFGAQLGFAGTQYSADRTRYGMMLNGLSAAADVARNPSNVSKVKNGFNRISSWISRKIAANRDRYYTNARSTINSAKSNAHARR